MRTSRLGFAAGGSPSLLLALPVLLGGLLPGWAGALEYRRAAVEAGELWRLVTGHWTHASGEHLMWNLAAAVALAVACRRCRPGTRSATIALAALGVGIAVHWAAPELGTYRGLSGIASALFALFAADLVVSGLRARRPGRAYLGGAALALLVGKATYEVVTGDALFVALEGDLLVVPVAHLAGGLVGAGVGFVPVVGGALRRGRGRASG